MALKLGANVADGLGREHCFVTKTTMADAFNTRTLKVGDSIEDASGRRYGVEGIQRRGLSPANVVRLRHTAGTLIVGESDFGNYYCM